MVFDELDLILWLCEVGEGKGREVAHLRNIKFHSRDPGKRDGRAYPKWTAWPGRGQAEWAAAFLLFTSGEKGSAKG